MIVYKLTCKSGKVYYGSSTLSLKKRAEKGWYRCACKDFDIDKMEVLEEIEGDDKNYLHERENYYIMNYDCVNKQVALRTEESYEKYKRDYYISSKDKIIEYQKENRKKIREEKRHYCTLCDSTFCSSKKLQQHLEGYNHRLKQECCDELGEDWRDGYKLWRGRKQDKKTKEEKRHYCKICDLTCHSPKKLQRHLEGYRHCLKQQCCDELGEGWRDEYKLWKVKKHEKTRKEKSEH